MNRVPNRLDEDQEMVEAAMRVSKVIERMTEPPETVLQHLKRIGVEPIIDQMVLDDGPPVTYVVFRYEELLEKELEIIAKGSTPEYHGVKPSSVKLATEPIVLDEIRRRMDAAKRRHPASQMSFDDLDYIGKSDVDEEEDEWPIIGENPQF